MGSGERTSELRLCAGGMVPRRTESRLKRARPWLGSEAGGEENGCIVAGVGRGCYCRSSRLGEGEAGRKDVEILANRMPGCGSSV